MSDAHTVGDAPQLARVEAAGCTVPIPAMELAPGVRIAIVADPEGTWVELVAKED